MMPVNNKNEYLFKLANRHQWTIRFSYDSTSISGQMANIMGLERSNINFVNQVVYTRTFNRNEPFESNNNLRPGDLIKSVWVNHIIGRVVLWTHPEHKEIICEIGPEMDSTGEALKIGDSLFVFYYYETRCGGLPIHTALIERNGQGFLLAARGETGKSTCCKRIPEPWLPLCDDEALIVCDDQHHYYAHPFPTWSNFVMDRPQRSWDVQRYVPLKAIYFIEQASKDEAIPIGPGDAASRIYYSSLQAYYRMLIYMDPVLKTSLKNQMFNNACELSKSIPSFILKVDLQGKFWEEIDKSSSTF